MYLYFLGFIEICDVFSILPLSRSIESSLSELSKAMNDISFNSSVYIFFV